MIYIILYHKDKKKEKVPFNNYLVRCFVNIFLYFLLTILRVDSRASESKCPFPFLFPSKWNFTIVDVARCIIREPMHGTELPRFIHAIAYEDTRRSIIVHDETQRA